MADLGNRRQYIGASELAAATGFSSWRTPRQVWQEKVGEVDSQDNFAMAVGRAIEPLVIDELRRRGWQFVAAVEAVSLSEYPPIVCHPDAISDDGIPVEIKTSGIVSPLRGWGAGPPVDYRIQVMAQAVALSRKIGKLVPSGVIVAVLGGVGMKTYSVDVDDGLMETVIDRARVFWDFVERQIPPPDDWPNGGLGCEEPTPVSRDIADLAIAYAEAWEELKSAESSLEETKERCELLRSSLVEACSGKDVAVSDDRYRVSVKHVVRKSLDQKLVRVQYPEVYESCVKELVIPSVTVKVVKGGSND